MLRGVRVSLGLIGFVGLLFASWSGLRISASLRRMLIVRLLSRRWGRPVVRTR
jgi:hypothetical protein